MPIFEYVCQECDHPFEALIYGGKKAECPKCQSKKLAQQLSVFAMSTKGSAGRIPFGGSMRELRRSARPRRLLDARHGLILSKAPPRSSS